MRFAIKTAPQHTTWQEILDVFRVADEIDLFESGWTFDHFYPIFTDPTGPCLEGWTTTTALAMATRRMRVGVMVTGNPYRHPAVLANIAATLDVISGGRLELGLGAGWNQEECDAYGIELPPLTERFDRLEEALAVITGLLGQERTDFEGRHYVLRDAFCEPKPIQRPHPPICIGGGGERRTIPIAARWAQHWNLPGGTSEVFAQKRSVLQDCCDAIGRDPADVTASIQLHYRRQEDPRAYAERAAEFVAAGCDLIVIPLPSPYSPDVLEPLAEALAPLTPE